MDRVKRDHILIIVEIIREARGGRRKTPLIRRANLDHMRGTKYLDICVDKGLLQYDSEAYYPTEKAHEFLEQWDTIQKHLE